MNDHSYQPPQRILNNYAKLLVNFALGETEGIQAGEVVQCMVPDIAKALGLELQNEILKAGGHPMMRIVPTGFDKDFYTHANHAQLTFFPKKHVRTRVQLIDHSIGIIADHDPFELQQIDPDKIVSSRDAKNQYREWMFKKELQGKLTWTLALWGVPAKAEIVGLSLESYWQQIINACFLDTENPVLEWRKVKAMQAKIRDRLNKLEIASLKVTGPDADLTVKLGAERIWKGGADRNIPSFELFTSPDWRGTEGWIRFNQPVYRYGNMINGVELHFKKGIITKATASKGESLLQSMLKSKNANKIGEFSLTDSRLSRITHPMAETLYDENIGGPFGNMHLAIGSAYRDCYRGNGRLLSQADWNKLGYNDSPEHTDIVSTADRTVVATLTNGSAKTIYKSGKFVL